MKTLESILSQGITDVSGDIIADEIRNVYKKRSAYTPDNGFYWINGVDLKINGDTVTISYRNPMASPEVRLDESILEVFEKYELHHICSPDAIHISIPANDIVKNIQLSHPNSELRIAFHFDRLTLDNWDVAAGTILIYAVKGYKNVIKKCRFKITSKLYGLGGLNKLGCLILNNFKPGEYQWINNKIENTHILFFHNYNDNPIQEHVLNKLGIDRLPVYIKKARSTRMDILNILGLPKIRNIHWIVLYSYASESTMNIIPKSDKSGVKGYLWFNEDIKYYKEVDKIYKFLPGNP